MPSPVLALPCGSISTSSTFSPLTASAQARLIAVVVLPTPPFWLATAMIRGRFLASDMTDLAHFQDARIVGLRRQTFDLHVPERPRRRQFKFGIPAFGKQAHT